MKRFIINILVGIVVFSVTWVLAEIMIGHVVVNEYSYKRANIQNNPAIKTLLIGHSHFDNSINPYLIGDSVYDFAIKSRCIYYDVQLLPRVIPGLPNLKTVIFPLGYQQPYGSLHYYELRDFEKDFIYYYAKYMDVYYDRFPESLYSRSALWANKMGIKYWKNEPQDSLGYSPIYGQVDDWEQSQNIRPDIIDGDTAALCYREYCHYLTQLAQICYENNIRFVAVTCPCANCFIANTREQGIQNLYDMVDSVAAHYPIEYYNYLADDEFRADSIYYNSSHLNSVGADTFAIRLKKDLGL